MDDHKTSMKTEKTTPPGVLTQSALFLDEKKAENLTVLDLREVANIADYFLVATAANKAHLKALSDGLQRLFKNAHLRDVRSAGTAESGWAILDCEGVMIHLFSQEMRDLYDLEKLWKDAVHVPINLQENHP